MRNAMDGDEGESSRFFFICVHVLVYIICVHVLYLCAAYTYMCACISLCMLYPYVSIS
jgi:hypothetical protein